MRLLLTLLLAACAPEAPAAPKHFTPGCDFDVSSMPTVGQSGRIGFGYFPAAAQALDQPMAAGGAHTNVLAFSSIDVTAIDNLRSSAPAVASFKLAAIAESSCQHQYLVTVHSGQPGSADLILVDAGGAEVDRVPVTVAPTESLLFDQGWDGPAPPTMLAGSLQGLHVTTVGRSGVLVGTGAVRFSFSGALGKYSDNEVEPPWWGGDAVTFTGSAGSGIVSADADHAHLEVPVNVVEESALTHFEVRVAPSQKPLTRDVFVSAAAGDTPVYGAECEWRWPLKLQPLWVDGGWIGAGQVTQYRFSVDQPGTYTAVCVLPGGTNQSVQLVFSDGPVHHTNGD